MGKCLLVDVDSTINNMEEVLLDILNGIYKTNYSVEDITKWDAYEELFGVNWYEPLSYPFFWKRVKVNPLAVAVLEEIAKNGWNVKLVTATSINHAIRTKIQQTLSYFNPELINEKNIIITQDKSCIYGDIMIDDNIENLQNNHLVWCKFLYAQPWNISYNERKMQRFENWKEIERELDILDSFET